MGEAFDVDCEQFKSPAVGGIRRKSKKTSKRRNINKKTHRRKYAKPLRIKRIRRKSQKTNALERIFNL